MGSSSQNMIIMKRWDLLLTYCSVSAVAVAHIFPFSPPSGGSAAAVEKMVRSSNFDQRDLSSGIGISPFYRSVPTRVSLSVSGGGGDSSSEGEGHPWPAYQRINSNHQVRTTNQAGLTEDQEKTAYLTVDEMRDFLRKLSRNNNLAAGREVKWGV